MNNFITLEDVLNATGGKLISGVNKIFTSIGTDTRSNLKDKLFIALQGEIHDAHQYLEQAVQAGAGGILIHRWEEKYFHLKEKTTIIVVPNTLLGLQQLGLFRRREWGKTIIAVTGSNGKTTTKEFIAQILSPYKNVHYNQGSFNNHWGLPLTLLGLQPEHEMAICEMGMNHAGEINTLVQIAEPNIVGITMVGRAHLEGLGSIEAIAAAKAEIYQFNKPNHIKRKIFNLDNPWTKPIYAGLSDADKQTCITFSAYSNQCDVCFNINKMTLDYLEITGHIRNHAGRAQIPVFGKQNIENIMFATCSALAAGLTPEQIWKALPSCKTIWGRNQKLSHPSGAEILFDAYNANPDSQKALIDNLKLISLDRPLIGVFGEMRELGENSPQLHEELGSLAATVPFKAIFFIGKYEEEFRKGFEKNSNYERTKDSLETYPEINITLLDKIKNLLDYKPLVAIKGSRGMELERILDYLSIT